MRAVLNRIMNCSTVSSGLCLNLDISTIDTPKSVREKCVWNLPSNSTHEFRELGGKDEYQANACPVKKLGNKFILQFSLFETSLHCIVNLDICSNTVLSSSLENVENFGILNPLGYGSLSIHFGYGSL